VTVTTQVQEAVAGAAVQKVAVVAQYGGSAGAVLFGLTANEFAAVAGVLIAFLGLVTNIAVTVYFKHQHLKLAKQRHRDGPDSRLEHDE
jgi:hypothetical protein